MNYKHELHRFVKKKIIQIIEKFQKIRKIAKKKTIWEKTLEKNSRKSLKNSRKSLKNSRKSLKNSRISEKIQKVIKYLPNLAQKSSKDLSKMIIVKK